MRNMFLCNISNFYHFHMFLFLSDYDNVDFHGNLKTGIMSDFDSIHSASAEHILVKFISISYNEPQDYVQQDFGKAVFNSQVLLPENQLLSICNTETIMSENHFSPCEPTLLCSPYQASTNIKALVYWNYRILSKYLCYVCSMMSFFINQCILCCHMTCI